MERKIAFLVYNEAVNGKRMKQSSFDGYGNIGVNCLIDSLRRKGVEVGFCSSYSADQFDVVLIPLTSEFSAYVLYRELRGLENWKKGKRKFKTIAGGFGMMNYHMIAEFVDKCWYGRCENEIYDLVTDDDFEHPSLLITDNPKDVYINQVESLYPYEVDNKCNGKDFKWKEQIYGCPNKCFFCNFSFTRKHIRTTEHYMLGDDGKQKSSVEIDMFNDSQIPQNIGFIKIGLDGVSERLRFAVNKRITNDMFVERVKRITEERGDKTTIFDIYCIVGYETECREDKEELQRTLERISDSIKIGRAAIRIHATNLTASPCTPVQYSSVLNVPCLPKKYRFTDKPHSFAAMDLYNPTMYNAFIANLCARYTEDLKSILDFTLISKFQSLDANAKIKVLKNKFDLSPITKMYDVNEKLPTSFIHTYIEDDKIRKMRLQMMRSLGICK